MKKAATKATSVKPRALVYPAIKRWLQWRDAGVARGRSNLDARLLTMNPVFVGIIAGLNGYVHGDAPASTKQLVLDIARRGVAAPPEGLADGRLAAVVCDWMIRCALPRWFDRLPAWCIDRASAQELSELSSLQWTDTVVRAIARLTPMWLYLEDAAQDRGTGDERSAVNAAHSKATDALGVLAQLLTTRFRYRLSDHGWICHMALALAFDESRSAPEADILETVPDLVSVLCSIKPGDSQRSIADRCVWPGAVASPKRDMKTSAKRKAA